MIITTTLNITCQKCGRSLRPVEYYTYKDGTKVEMCKKCLTMHVDNWDPSTYTWIMEKMNIPYIPEEWNVLRDRAFAKDPYKMNGGSVIGKYISKMKLKQWKEYTWADTERLQKEAELRQIAQAEEKARVEAEVKKDFEEGKITEAQYKTFMSTAALKEEMPSQPPMAPPVVGQENNPYASHSVFISEEELPDVGADLSQEEKQYLALKWGRLYTPSEWVSLETLYKDFMESYTIKDAGRLDTLKKICKTSLKMDQAIDTNDMDGFNKLSRTYDNLMKSGKFTEAQKKEEKAGEFDSVGQIVNFAESKKGGGKIARHKVTVPLDIVDETMFELKAYPRVLVEKDPSVKQLIENYIKKREIAQEQAEDEKLAKKQGLESYQITDQDLINFKQSMEDLRLETAEMVGGN